jgi:hypothetical protein
VLIQVMSSGKGATFRRCGKGCCAVAAPGENGIDNANTLMRIAVGNLRILCEATGLAPLSIMLAVLPCDPFPETAACLK